MKNRMTTRKRVLIIVALVACGTLAASQGIMAGTTQPGPDFKIGNLLVPAEAPAGQKLTISATISNSANFDGTYEGTLKINGSQEATKAVHVPPKSERTISFSVSRSEPGTYEVDLDGLTGTFTVVAKAAGSEKAAGFPVGAVVGAAAGVIVLAVLVYLWLSNRKRVRS